MLVVTTLTSMAQSEAAYVRMNANTMELGRGGRHTCPVYVASKEQMDAIVAYMMQCLFDFREPSRFLFGALAKLFPSPDFVIMSGYTLICWLILWYLYRKDTFLKV